MSPAVVLGHHARSKCQSAILGRCVTYESAETCGTDHPPSFVLFIHCYPMTPDLIFFSKTQSQSGSSSVLSRTMIGYGDEISHFAIELLYTYTPGTPMRYGGLKTSHPDRVLESIRVHSNRAFRSLQGQCGGGDSLASSVSIKSPEGVHIECFREEEILSKPARVTTTPTKSTLSAGGSSSSSSSHSKPKGLTVLLAGTTTTASKVISNPSSSWNERVSALCMRVANLESSVHFWTRVVGLQLTKVCSHVFV